MIFTAKGFPVKIDDIVDQPEEFFEQPLDDLVDRAQDFWKHVPDQIKHEVCDKPVWFETPSGIRTIVYGARGLFAPEHCCPIGYAYYLQRGQSFEPVTSLKSYSVTPLGMTTPCNQASAANVAMAFETEFTQEFYDGFSAFIHLNDYVSRQIPRSWLGKIEDNTKRRSLVCSWIKGRALDGTNTGDGRSTQEPSAGDGAPEMETEDKS